MVNLARIVVQKPGLRTLHQLMVISACYFRMLRRCQSSSGGLYAPIHVYIKLWSVAKPTTHYLLTLFGAAEKSREAV